METKAEPIIEEKAEPIMEDNAERAVEPSSALDMETKVEPADQLLTARARQWLNGRSGGGNAVVMPTAGRAPRPNRRPSTLDKESIKQQILAALSKDVAKPTNAKLKEALKGPGAVPEKLQKKPVRPVRPVRPKKIAKKPIKKASSGKVTKKFTGPKK